MRGALQRVAAAALAGWLAAAPAGAEPAPGAPGAQVLSIEEARGLALAAHRAKDARLARGLALALLRRDPGDVVARQILAAALYAEGDFAGAEAEGARAYRAAPRGPARHDAAMIVSEAAFQRGEIGTARRWLRRAAWYAPDAQAEALAVRAYQGLAPAQKFTWSFDFSVSPSSNVNGGSATDTVTIGTFVLPLPGALTALSGVQSRASLGGGWVLGQSARSRWQAGVSATGLMTTLSSEAKAKAPGAKGSDYAFWALEAWAAHRAQLAGGAWDARATAGHNDYAGAPLSNYLRLEAGRDFAIAPRMALRMSGLLERQFRLDAKARSATMQRLGLDLGWRAAGPGAGSWKLGSYARRAISGTDSIAFEGGGVSLDYRPEAPLWGADWALSLGYESRDYANGRADDILDAGVSATLPALQYMGFAPELGLSWRRDSSNNVIHDGSELGLTLGLRSLF
ncbi:hypothetical protein LPB142_05365 [Rhodobacter xanthinilyticus]|uniref:DUF560 domain-containing protein n=1 Tax=Rhodobacter xanthinilyticus TaxID=1850250 RepID=A0A1D9MAJ6_9RHOB|nr:hypothetical protein [Rhodobacter xanthinilyticus]AOZ68818.1 hypothetical protein LPB142_05365 [Rhodobacter xanthinilyticus]